MKYFVMLVGGDGSPVPMIDSDDDVWGDRVKLFDTEEEAHIIGGQNLLGMSHGYQVIEWDWMED